MPLKPVQTAVIVHALLLAAIILPFLFWGDAFDRFALELMSGEHVTEVFLLTSFLLMSDILIPIPSSAVSVSAGLVLGMPLAFLACLAGQTLGCLLAYGFGFYFRRHHFDRWHSDYEFRFLSSDLSRYGPMILIVLRGVPILAEMSVLVAGFHRLAFAQFFLATLVGNVILAGLYTALGGTATNLTSVYVLAAGFLLIPLITLTARLYWQRRAEVHRG